MWQWVRPSSQQKVAACSPERSDRGAETSSDSKHTLHDQPTQHRHRPAASPRVRPVLPGGATSSRAKTERGWKEGRDDGGSQRYEWCADVARPGGPGVWSTFVCVCVRAILSANRGNWSFHGRHQRAIAGHDEMTREKKTTKKKHLTPPLAWEGLGFWLRFERRWRKHRSQVCSSGERAEAIGQVCVWEDVWSRRDWASKHQMGAAALDRSGSASRRRRRLQVSARFNAQDPTSTCCPAEPGSKRKKKKKNRKKTKREGGDLLLSQPSTSSSSGIRRHFRASSALINANYMGLVINLGTQVLADENKTLRFFFSQCECQQLSLRSRCWEPCGWGRRAGRQGIKMALLFGVCVGLSLSVAY